MDEKAQVRLESAHVPEDEQLGAGLQQVASPPGHELEAVQNPFVHVPPARQGWSVLPALRQHVPMPPGQVEDVAQASHEPLHTPFGAQGCIESPAGTQQLVRPDGHWGLWMQVLPAEQVAAAPVPMQAGKGGSQHLDSPFGQLIETHESGLLAVPLHASPGPQGWSLAPEGTR